VLAQRLGRKLCTHCCEMYTPSVEELIKARVSPDIAAQADGMIFYRKRGCPRCNQTGYKGRIGIFQLLAMSETLETLAAQKASRRCGGSATRRGIATPGSLGSTCAEWVGRTGSSIRQPRTESGWTTAARS